MSSPTARPSWARGMYFKLVISEKQEYLLNHLGTDGLPDRNGGNFYGWGGSPNRRHTWRAVVDKRTIPAASGTVSIDLQRANAAYTVTWYNTTTGQSSSTQALTADNAGVLVLSLSDLTTDTAARITRNP